jgi:hypothetical protein
MTYYVSQLSGSDSNNGVSLITPFKTIQKCADSASSGNICAIRAGIYRETVNVTRDGISFMPYNNEDVTISALEILTGRLQSGTIWKATMNWTMNDPTAAYHITRRHGLDQLFLDGKMLVPARYPNVSMDRITSIQRSDLLKSDAGGSVSTTQYYYTDTALSAFNGMTG